MSWKLPSSRPERLYKEPLLTPAFPAALSEIIKPLGPGVSPHTPDSGVPIHRRQWAQKPNQYSASAQLSGLWKSKEITAQHCSSSSRWQTLWESQHSSPQHFACDAALVHSALSDWANYPGGPPARLGSARLCSAAVAHGGLTAAAAKESLSPGHKQEVNPSHRPSLHWLWSAY